MSRLAFFRFREGVALLALAGFLGACNHQAEPEASSAASTAASAPAEPAVTIETGDRSIEITEKAEAWPAEIPDEAPRFASGTIRKIIRTETPEGSSWDMAIDGLQAHSLKAYAEALKAAGFETSSMIVSEGEGDRGSVTGLKGELSVVLIASGSNASLSVIRKQ